MALGRARLMPIGHANRFLIISPKYPIFTLKERVRTRSNGGRDEKQAWRREMAGIAMFLMLIHEH